MNNTKIEVSDHFRQNILEVMAEAANMLKDAGLHANPTSFRCTWAELTELGRELQLALEKPIE